VDHNLLKLILYSSHILLITESGVWLAFRRTCCGVVQEDQDAGFFETSATRPSAHVENPNKRKTTTECHAKVKPVIIYYNPTK
jgi:hypothetical protein